MGRAWLADQHQLLVGVGRWFGLQLCEPPRWQRQQHFTEQRIQRVLRLKKSLVFYVQRLTFKF